MIRYVAIGMMLIGTSFIAWGLAPSADDAGPYRDSRGGYGCYYQLTKSCPVIAANLPCDQSGCYKLPGNPKIYCKVDHAIQQPVTTFEEGPCVQDGEGTTSWYDSCESTEAQCREVQKCASECGVINVLPECFNHIDDPIPVDDGVNRVNVGEACEFT